MYFLYDILRMLSSNVENCVYCQKEYTKRGMKRHTNKCSKNTTNAATSDNKQRFSILALPDDCLKIIKEYLMYKEKYVTYKRLFLTHLNYALTCKVFSPFSY